MKVLYTFLSFLLTSLLAFEGSQAQEGWPKSVTASNGATIKMYQWQPESFNNNVLVARAAISVTESGKTDPTFGVAWIKANAETVNQQVTLRSIQITDIKLPGDRTDNQSSDIRSTLERAIPQWNLSFTTNDLNDALTTNQQESKLSSQINNNPPKVVYTTRPSMQVIIDGTPQLKRNDDWGVEAVVNTPFTIIKNNDGRFYLRGGNFWYVAPSATGPYSYIDNPPSNLQKVEQAIRQNAAKNNDSKTAGAVQDNNAIYNIIASTEPQELIQSRGEASFTPIQGTSLLYVSNSDNDIFMDVNSQEYYVLISGRWYRSKTLGGDWQYISSDKLPADFARIPEGSPKDNVLSSVAGTQAAKEAVMQAQIPQTAKVDRSKAQAKVDYDGDPEFQNIDGTEMAYAVNTPVSVIRWRGRYYCVDNGVWFESYAATGPWSVCVTRPYAVAYIPPRYPVYNMKYVYIYDVMPDYVYMGYTPGYLNTYIYGPTIVYGTGYYYRPWYGHYYYPRPCTWGFYMRYNPWIGWGTGFDLSVGWFHGGGYYDDYYDYGRGGWGGYYRSCGWWGPAAYRPPYCAAPYRQGWGYYGDYYGSAYGRQYNNVSNRNVTIVNNTTNIYNYRRDVVTRDNPRLIDNRNFNRPGYAGSDNRPDRIRPGYSNNANGGFGDNRPGRDNNMNNRPENNNGNNPFGGNRPGRDNMNNRPENNNNNNPLGGNRPGRDNMSNRPENNNNDNNPFGGNRPGRINDYGRSNGNANNSGNRPGWERPGNNSDNNRNGSPENRPGLSQEGNIRDWRNNGRNDNYRPRPMITNPDMQQPSQPQRIGNGGDMQRPQRQIQSYPSTPQSSGSEQSRPGRIYGGGGGESRPSGGGELRPQQSGGGERPGRGSAGGSDNGGGRIGRRG